MNYIKNKNEFEDVIKKEKVIIDFYADWCGPCQMLSPILEKVSRELNLDTYKVNVDEVEDIARNYGIMSIPTIMLFSKGNLLKKNVGFMSEDELKSFVE